MKAINFSESTTTFGGDNYLDLPAIYTNGRIISCWKPSFIERIKILFGQNIWLHIKGSTQPPVLLDVNNPFEE